MPETKVLIPLFQRVAAVILSFHIKVTDSVKSYVDNAENRVWK